MSIVTFNDKEIIASNVLSWPDSPDRTEHGTGREAYASTEVQSILTEPTPNQSLALMKLADILANHEPFTFEGTTLYKKDPTLEITKFAAKQNVYIADDIYPPTKWKGGGTVSFKRLHEITGSPKLFISGPDMIDMSQQGLGNCGFVSAMGAVALHPEGHNIIFSSIYPCVYNPFGVYSVRIVTGSSVGYLIIDDLFPTAGFSAMVNKQEFWYLVIEKAISKLRGGYNKLDGGREKYFGIKSTSNTAISATSADKVWNSKFKEIFQVKQHPTYQGTGYSPKYLVGGHAYALIDAQEWNGIRLVRLHNPWNWANYKGPYSPGSSEWETIPTEIQESIFQVSRFAGRTFWMPYDLYWSDLPKISDMYISASIPASLKKIAANISIQE